MELHERIRWVRERLGLSLRAMRREFPNTVGVDTLFRYEKGINYPPTDFIITLILFARSRDVPVNPAWILMGEGDFCEGRGRTPGEYEYIRTKIERLEKQVDRLVRAIPEFAVAANDATARHLQREKNRRRYASALETAQGIKSKKTKEGGYGWQPKATS